MDEENNIPEGNVPTAPNKDIGKEPTLSEQLHKGLSRFGDTPSEQIARSYEDIKNNARKKGIRLRGRTQNYSNDAFATPVSQQSKFDRNINRYNSRSLQEITDHRANEQGWGYELAAGVGRVGSTIAAETLKLPGYIAGIAVGAVGEINEALGGEKSSFVDKAFNNGYVNTIQDMYEGFNEQHLPVYVNSQVSGGNIFKNLMSLEFWATEGAQGLGYAISSFGPGLLGRGLSLGSKLSKLATGTARATLGAKSAIKVGEGTANIAKALSNVGITANRIDNGTMAMISTFSEASSGAHLQMRQFDEEAKLVLEDKMAVVEAQLKDAVNNGTLTQEQADEQYNIILQTKQEELAEQRALLGRDTFLAYSTILMPSNFLQASMIFGKGASATKYKGRGTFGQKVQRFGKVAGTSLVSEGAYEEGSQSTVENVLMDKAHKGQLEDNWAKGWFTKDFELFNMSPLEFTEGYLDMIGTTEGQKAVILGGLIGTGMTSVGQWTKGDKSHNRRIDALLESVTPYNETIEDVLTSGIYERDNKGRIVTDNDNKPKINTAAAKRLVEAMSSQVELATKLQEALDSGNTQAIESAYREVLLTSAISYAQHGELGLEALQEKIDQQLEAVKEDPESTPEQIKHSENAAKEFKDIANRVTPILNSFDNHILSRLERPTDPEEAEVFDRFVRQERNDYAKNRLYNQVFKNELADINKTINAIEAETQGSVQPSASVYSDVLEIAIDNDGKPFIRNKNTGASVKALTSDEYTTDPITGVSVNEDVLNTIFEGLDASDKIIGDPRLQNARRRAYHLENAIKNTEKESLKYWDSKYLADKFEKMSEQVEEETRINNIEVEYADTLSAIRTFDNEEGLRDYQKTIHNEAKKSGRTLPPEIDAIIEEQSAQIVRDAEKAKSDKALENRSITPEPDTVMSNGKINEFLIDGRNLDVFNLIDAMKLNRYIVDEIKDVLSSNESASERFRKIKELINKSLRGEGEHLNIFDNTDVFSLVIDGEMTTPKTLFDAVYKEFIDEIGRFLKGSPTNTSFDEMLGDMVDNGKIEEAAKVISKLTEFITTLDTLEVTFNKFNREDNSLYTEGIRKYIHSIQKSIASHGFTLHEDSLSQIDNDHRGDYTYQVEYYSDYVEQGAEIAGRVSAPRITYNGEIVAKGKVASIKGRGEERAEVINTIRSVNDVNTVPLLKILDFLNSLEHEINIVNVIESQNRAMMEGNESDLVNDEVSPTDDISTVTNNIDAIQDGLDADILNKNSADISVKLLSTNNDGNTMQGISNDDYVNNFEQGEKDRLGEYMSFEPTVDLSGLDAEHNAVKAKELLNEIISDENRKATDEELQFLYDHLPIQAVSQDGLKTSIAAKRDTTNEDSLSVWEKHERPLRVQIVDAFLESKKPTTGTKRSKVVYSSQGGFNLKKDPVTNTFPDNSIEDMLERDENGDINEDKAVKRLGVGRTDGTMSRIDGLDSHPMSKKKSHYVPGEIYLEVKHGKNIVPMKLNQTRLTDAEVNGLFELIKVIMEHAVDADKTSMLRSLNINETLLKVKDDVRESILNDLKPHLNYLKSAGDVSYNVYNLLALIIHVDSVNKRTYIDITNDGKLQVGEMIGSVSEGRVTQTVFGLNELTENPDNADAVKAFLRHKRRNVIIGPKATYGYNQQLYNEIGASLDNPEYFNYIVESKGLSTNATIVNGSPFKKGNYFVGPLKEYSVDNKSEVVSENTPTPRKAEASSPSQPVVNIGNTSSTSNDTSQQIVQQNENKVVTYESDTIKVERSVVNGAINLTITNKKTGEAMLQMITPDNKVLYAPILGNNVGKSIVNYDGKSNEEIFNDIFKDTELKDILGNIIDTSSVYVESDALEEAQPTVSQQPNTAVKISPSAKKIADDNNITDDELLNIKGTGKDGNILKSDIEGYIRNQASLNFNNVDQEGNISEDTEGIENIEVVSNIIDEIVVDFKEINDLLDLEDTLNNLSNTNTNVNNNNKQSLEYYFANAVRNDASYRQIINMTDEEAFIEMHNLFDKVANDMKNSQKNNRTCQI